MKLRQPNSIEDALLEVFAVLGIDTAAEVVNRSEAHLRRWSDPDEDSKPSITQCIALDSACLRESGEAPLLAIYSYLIKEALEAEKHEDAAIGDLFLDMTSHIGKVAEELQAACSPKSKAGTDISHCEATKLRRMIAVLCKSAQRMDRVLKRKQNIAVG